MKVVLLIGTLLITHILSFILQYIYQKFCFPITISGFFRILFIHENNMCVNIRNTSHLLQNIVSNIIIQSFVTSISSFLIGYMSSLTDKNKIQDK
jgi:hypothetical protein